MQSLIDNKLIEEGVSVDTSLPKVITVGVIGVILAGIFGYFLNIAILNDGFQNIIYAFLTASAFLSIFLLQIFFLKSNRIIDTVIFLESLAIAAPLFRGFSWWFFLAWVSLLAAFRLAVYVGRSELENQIKIKFFRIERAVIPSLLTAISLFAALVYMSIFSTQGAFIAKSSFNSLIRPAAPFLANYFPNFSFDMTMSKLAEVLAVSQLGGQIGALPPAQRSLVINQILSQLQSQFSQYGLNFKNSDTITDVLYNYLNSQLNRIPEGFKFLIPLSFALLLFLTIKGVAIFLRWIISMPAFLLYELALFSGFAKLSLESRSRAIIVLK